MRRFGRSGYGSQRSRAQEDADERQGEAGARFVDPLPVFNPSISSGGSETGDVATICALTGMCPGGTYNPGAASADIHPSKQGYAALASLFESASGF